MEILIIAPDDSQRAGSFQQFLTGQAHTAARVAPGQRIPVSKQSWQGAACFDADLPAQVGDALQFLSIPLAVIAKVPAATPMPVDAASAAWICDPAKSDAQILHDLQSRCRIHALALDQRKQLAQPLVTAVEQTLSQMASTDAIVSSMYQRDQPTALGDLSVTLSLSRGLDGLMILSFSKSTAEAFARRILADAGEELDPAMVKDCIGEIANIVAGQAKALFHGTPHHFVFSTPTVTIGQQGMTFKDGMTSMVIAFDSEQGAFALQVCRCG